MNGADVEKISDPLNGVGLGMIGRCWNGSNADLNQKAELLTEAADLLGDEPECRMLVDRELSVRPNERS